MLASETDLQLGPIPLATSTPKGLACGPYHTHVPRSRSESECPASSIEFPLISISPILPPAEFAIQHKTDRASHLSLQASHQRASKS